MKNQRRPARLLAGLPSRLIAEALDRLPVWLFLAAYEIDIRSLDTLPLLWGAWLLFSFAWVIAALWLFSKGQTPGKRLMGIRVVKRNGDPVGWWRMFAREVLIKWFLIAFLAGIGLGMAWFLFAAFLGGITFGLAIAVDYLWPLWDRRRQALHDKIMGTAVVRARR